MSESGYAVFNSTEIIENNYDKVKQLKLLDDDDIPHIKTKVVSRDINSELTKVTYPYVVKPAVSGSGENTFLVRDKNDLEHYLPRMQRIIEKRELLVQPFIEEIREGEMSVIAINGKLSHAVKRFPGVLDKKGYRVEYISLESLEADLIKFCERIIRIPRYRNCLYLRMDTVRINNKIYMMELELFEPQLFYYLLPTPQREKAFDEIWKYLKEHIH